MLKKSICLILIFCVFMPYHAFADESSDTIKTTYVDIPGEEPLAVDWLNDIPAYYLPGELEPYCEYSCLELIRRYYREKYDIFFLPGYENIPDSKTYGDLRLTNEPKVGDIVYWPPGRREVSWSHYALVKEVKADSLVLIEQNWKWVENGNAKAAINREIIYPSPTGLYDVWTYVPEVRVFIDQTQLFPENYMEQAAFLNEGRVYIQGKMLSEALGVAVEYDAASKTAIWGKPVAAEKLAGMLPKSDGTTRTTFDGVEGYLKDSNQLLGVPVIIDGRTYFPLRALCEWLGCDVSWNGGELTVHVTTGDGKTHPEFVVTG